jgi:carbon monoxide dehydrogenase subunit G
MELDHTFTVPVGVKQAWDVLLDLPRIAPCMPGATLTEHDDERFAGTVKVKLGPINLTYRGTGRFVERDEDARRVVLEASGRDTRSAGTASATITATLHPNGDERTEVRVHTDLSVTGRPAQFGRGVLADVSSRLISEFAGCLASTLSASEEPDEEHDRGVPTPEEVQAIDLLEMTRASSTVRRYAFVAAVMFGAAAAIWVLVGRRRR